MHISAEDENSPDKISVAEIVVQCFLYSSILVAGSLLNTSIIWLVWTQKSLRSITNLWVSSLCMSQLLVSVFVLPLSVISAAADRWIFGRKFCWMFGYLMFVFRTVSIFSVAAIALNRYHVVCKPFRKRIKRKTVKILIAFLWWSAAIVCSPPLFGIGSFRYSSSRHMCHFSWNSGGSTLIFTSFYVTSVFISSLITVVWSYLLIYKITRAHVNKQAILTISRSKSDNHLNWSTSRAPTLNSTSSRANRFRDLILLRHTFIPRDQASGQSRMNLDEKAGRLIAIILIVFVIAWTPYFFLAIHSAASDSFKTFTSATRWMDFTIVWVSLTPCVLDPLFYGVLTKNFKGHFQKHFCFWKKRKKDSSMTVGPAATPCADAGRQRKRGHVKNKNLPGIAFDVQPCSSKTTSKAVSKL